MQFRKSELDLFPTPVSLYDLSEVNLTPLLDLIDSFEKKKMYLVNNGVSTFGTGSSILDHQDLSELKSFISECLFDYTNRLGIFNLEICESWFNMTLPGGKLDLHRHEGSVVSGAFYPTSEEITPLLFKTPISPYKMNELYKPNVGTQYAFGFNTVFPSKGMLILFPSWLEHKTDTEIGERLVVSFNTYYTNENLDVSES